MKIDKISFLLPSDERFEKQLELLSYDERDAADEIVDFYLSLEAEAEFSFSLTDGALIVRIFSEGEYSFIFPYELSERASITSAVENAVRYAILEEIDPIFNNVPGDMLETFSQLGFRYIEPYPESAKEDTYRALLKNECHALEDIPSASLGEISLSPLMESDISDYARLCRDSENNKYWGYDFSEDFPDCRDDFFIELAKREFFSSTSISFAVRHRGVFVGEALISSFDYKGGADVSVRILPEHQNKGYAKAALELILKVSADIGLLRLYARVFSENLPSLRLFSKNAGSEREENGVRIFVYGL